jgi:SAM-dependent methyltransferase
MMRAESIRNLSDDAQRVAGYRGKPFPQTHPDRLATVARLHGIAAPPPERCRVLELGCGDGGNLIPMAFELEGSSFVGIDLDPRRIADGQGLIQELGLENVELFARDISEVGDEYGLFDYIIAHGVYCWVPLHVRDHLLTLCRSLLDAGGVAFVSFNALPGWHFLEYMRDFAVLAAEQEGSPGDALTRIRSLAKVFSDGLGGAGAQNQHLKELFDRLLGSSDYLLAFDYLGNVSEPLSLGEFVSAVEEKGLRYVADANFFETELKRVPARVRTALTKEVTNPLAREKLADFFGARLFRRALICKAEQTVALRDASAVKDFQVLAPVLGASGDDDTSKPTPTSFTMLHQVKLTVSAPIVKNALTVLGESWPQSLSFGALVERVTQSLALHTGAEVERVLAEAIWELYGAGAVDLRCSPPRCAQRAGERPTASLLARLRLSDGGETVNQHHELACLTDNVSRALFRLLDGTHTRRELAEALTAAADAGSLALSPAERSNPSAVVEQRLAAWAAHALLVSQEPSQETPKGGLGGSRPS